MRSVSANNNNKISLFSIILFNLLNELILFKTLFIKCITDEECQCQ